MSCDGINVSGGTDVNKTSESKECDICHYWYVLDKGFQDKIQIVKRLCGLAVNISIRQHMELFQMRVQNEWEAIFSLFITDQYYTSKMFLLRVVKNFRQGCFLNCCFLVYLANYVKLLRTVAF